MIQTLLARRGYGYGSGMLSPDCQQFIVSIPKNASSLLVDWTTKNSWTSAIVGDSCSWHNCQEFIVVLRDPLDRWISGVAQYITSYILNITGAYSQKTGPGPNDQQISADQFISEYNTVVERLLFDQLSTLDDHVWPQTDFFVDLMPGVTRTYFYIDSGFEVNIGKYLKFQPLTDLDHNKGSDNTETKKIIDFIKLRLNTRPELVNRVLSAYAQDHEFIKNTKFTP
jgi:hypothetical protein